MLKERGTGSMKQQPVAMMMEMYMRCCMCMAFRASVSGRFSISKKLQCAA